MTPDANKHVSGKLMQTRLALIDFASGHRTMTREDVRQLEAQIKGISLHAAIVENRLLSLAYPQGLPTDAEEIGISQLYAVFDGLVDVTKVLMDLGEHPADMHPHNLQAVARRVMEVARDAQALVHEVSRHRWNAAAWQEQVARLMAPALHDLAAYEAADTNGNVVVLGRGRPIGG